jgi:DNA double-strand break repair helicase HerA and related ATPase
VELLTLSGDPVKGVPVRASVSEFGAPLLAKVLDLNDTQASVLSLVFHDADSAGLLLVDLKDLREVLRFLGTDEGQQAVSELGGVAKPTLGCCCASWWSWRSRAWPGCSASPPSTSTTCSAPTRPARAS